MSLKATPEQQLTILCHNVMPLLQRIVDGYTYDPNAYNFDPDSADLDDQLPIVVSMTLGDYRRAKRLLPQVVITIQKGLK